MESMRERRNEARLLCADMVEVRWLDRWGRPRQAAALLEDIAPSGACIQFEVEIPPGTEVRVTCTHGVLEGMVRYCVYREIGYFVGVQFAEGSRWSRQEYEPEHLLDLERLVADAKAAEEPE